MPKRGEGTEFVEALARGLDVIECFGEFPQSMSLSAVASATGLARPTARRILLTLKELGYVDVHDGQFVLAPRVLKLGMSYVSSLHMWDIARPHMEELVRTTGESCSMAQMTGSDIVYVARVAVPKIIALRVEVGTTFPAQVTSMGKVLMAALTSQELAEVLATPSRSPVHLPLRGSTGELEAELATVRARGWALADEELAPGVRSIAVPIRDGSGKVHAAMNVTVHAAETTTAKLLDEHLPRLIQAASDVSADWALWQSRPKADVSLTRP